MSADAEVVPVAWLYESEESCAGPFEARHVRISIDRSGPYRGETETPLYSADTIAALKKDAERLDWLDKHPREATIRVGTDMKACVFYGVSCDPKWTMREAIDAAIDAAQSTEGERNG